MKSDGMGGTWRKMLGRARLATCLFCLNWRQRCVTGGRREQFVGGRHEVWTAPAGKTDDR
jgi:hypothetical protein